MNLFSRFWDLLHAAAHKLTWLPPLLARISLGVVFVQSGWGKLTHLDKVIGFFTQLGIPAARIQAPFVGCVELGCGGAVLLGLLTRATSLPLVGVMVVAILTAKLKQVAGLSDFLSMEEYLFIILLFWLHIEGPGAVSLDQLLLKDRK
jgi:putative oxidoreductase